MTSLISRYSAKIKGVLSCYDRVILQGTLPGICYAQGMTSYLYSRGIRVFDYPRFAEPFRDAINENAKRLAEKNGLEIEFIRKYKSFRKEARISEILDKRGLEPGLVHIFSAMESCDSYKPWHDKKSGKTFLRPDSGRCLHYYFYFIAPELGLCYLRVPTWAPFRLQFYFNGHNLLASMLEARGIGYRLVDNAFVDVEAWELAQELSDNWKVSDLHKALDWFAETFCPVAQKLETTYHWSIMQVEYATDVAFKRREDLQAIYGSLTRTVIHTVKPDKVATFLGRKLSGNYQGELGNDFNTRIEGTRIKHHMGPASIKMYDKFGLAQPSAFLRIFQLGNCGTPNRSGGLGSYTPSNIGAVCPRASMGPSRLSFIGEACCSKHSPGSESNLLPPRAESSAPMEVSYEYKKSAEEIHNKEEVSD